ncbi:antibiotic biosynthesis monooxygenase family protein [Paraburkholderia silvatlantica]|uniref:antibiotic biosynthesis monooxygenase family protein n=1 Tax=Paraburkholderia silvatlantica TaxID=321895 RepID=UPI00375361D8
MIVAIGRFYLRADKISHFEAAWLRVCPLLVNKPGYRGHRLGPQCEDEGCYVLEVEWDSLDAQSAFMMHGDFQTFLHTLWPYFSADPDLYHFAPLVQQSRFPAI